MTDLDRLRTPFEGIDRGDDVDAERVAADIYTKTSSGECLPPRASQRVIESTPQHAR